MSTRIQTALVMLGITMILGYGFWPTSTPAQNKAPARLKWEYKIVRAAGTRGTLNPIGMVVIVVPGKTYAPPPRAGVVAEETLTALGEQGWELIKITDGQPFVSSFQVMNAGALPPTQNTIDFTDTVYYFKRPK